VKSLVAAVLIPCSFFICAALFNSGRPEIQLIKRHEYSLETILHLCWFRRQPIALPVVSKPQWPRSSEVNLRQHGNPGATIYHSENRPRHQPPSA
jgi:hypothetical protein